MSIFWRLLFFSTEALHAYRSRTCCQAVTALIITTVEKPMASVIGTVWRVLGDVFAVAGNGSKRLLVAGDRVFIGEQVQAGSDGAVAIRLRTVES